jgi:hypothetical protein
MQPTASPTDSRTDLITVLFSTWLMAGLFLDGYAHSNLIEELESFLTPWHAVFYSGFVATALWVTWTIAKRFGDGDGFREAIPPGYGLSVIGIGVFVLGGVGDAVWHTILGIEQGIDTLLSPTHLLLFLGIFLIMTTPIRSAFLRDGGGTLSGLDRYSVTLSATLTTALLAFFFFYIWAPGHAAWAQQPFDGPTGEGELFVALGIGGILVSNLILLGPLSAILARWGPPIGLVTLTWGASSALTAAAFDLDLGLALAVGVAGGLGADGIIHLTDAGPASRVGTTLTLVIAPICSWSIYFLGIGMSGRLQWPPEIWGGAILFAALTGLGLTAMSPRVAPTHSDRRLVESGAG